MCSKAALLELPGQKYILHGVTVIAGGCAVCHFYAFVCTQIGRHINHGHKALGCLEASDLSCGLQVGICSGSRSC